MRNSFMKQMGLMFMLLFLPTICANAQEEEVAASGKTTVFVEICKGTNEAQVVRNAVLSVLTKFTRLVIIDPESEAVANIEDIRRTTPNVTAGNDMVPERLGAVVRLGAQYYILPIVDNISQTSTNNGKSSTAKCQITLTIKVIDPAESKILTSQQMTFSGINSNNVKEEAFNAALTSISNKGNVIFGQNPLMQLVESQFPITGQILDINESKKDKAVSVYINAGSSNGVEKGTKFIVLREKQIGSRTAMVPVGELSAEDVQAEDLTLCKVSKGGDVILKEFNNGTVLQIKSRAKKDL